MWFALMEKFFPGINFTNISPQDIMHLFADGITRNEGAWLLYMLHSRGYLRLAEVNALIRNYRWPRATAVPQIPQSVEDGVTGRYPRKEATLGMSASQTFVFAQHSIALLSPKLSEEAKKTPYWRSWVAHVAVLEVALRDEFHPTDVSLLDERIQQHHRLFLKVKEYDGLWKPKHHFETHLPVDLLRFGPLRGYWCMSFEGFNKIVKQATEISNYRSEDMFVLGHWMMKSAKVLRRLRDSTL